MFSWSSKQQYHRETIPFLAPASQTTPCMWLMLCTLHQRRRPGWTHPVTSVNTHIRKRQSVSECQSRLLFPPCRDHAHWGTYAYTWYQNEQSGCYFSTCHIKEAKGGSYSFTRLLALAVSLHENNWKAGWTTELVIRDKILFRQRMCFWSGCPW